MTTLPSTSRSLRPDHDQLVERTLALLPQRRSASRPVEECTPPGDRDAYCRLLDRIDAVREGALIGSDARAGIMHEAAVLGIRPFDASMMIALAQDRARRGESTENIPHLLRARPAPRSTTDTDSTAPPRPDLMTWFGVAASGLLIAGLVAGWFVG